MHIMKAKDYKKKACDKFGPEVIIDTKKNGIRCVAIITKYGLEMYSSGWKRMTHFEPLFTVEMKALYIANNSISIILDGELMARTRSETLVAKGKHGTKARKYIKFYVFDIMDLIDWCDNDCIYTQLERKSKLDLLFNYIKDLNLALSLIIKLDYDIVVNREDFIKDYFTSALDNGEEGIMIKDPEGIYEWKRSSTWLKMKECITIDLPIIDIKEGLGRNKGRMGALIIEGYHEDQFIHTHVGTGFTDKDREWFWANQEDLIGAIVEVKAQSILKSLDRDKSIGSLETARYQCLRLDLD